MSLQQWTEWKAWFNIRGPIGGPRMDYYMHMLTMALAQLNPNVKDIAATDYVMDWLRYQEVNMDAHIRPWVDTRGVATKKS